MLICREEHCNCSHHRLLTVLTEESYMCDDEAKTIIDSLENVGELTDDSGKTLLHYVVESRNEYMTQYLLDKGCKVDAQDASGVSPLMLAVKTKYLYTVEVLLKSHADIFVGGCRAISSLVEFVTKTMYRWSYLEEMTEELMWQDEAMADRIFSMVSTEIDGNFSKSESHRQSLLNASDSAKLAMVALCSVETAKLILEESGYPIDYCEDECSHATALHWALFFKKLENAKLLIEHGVNVDLFEPDYNFPPLIFYIDYLQDLDKEAEVLTSLMRHSVSWSAGGQCRAKDVEWALTSGNEQTVRAVLLSGINVETCLTEDLDLLSCLLDNRKPGVCDLLFELDIKFDVNQRNPNGETALMIACSFRAEPANIEFLLKYGADVNARTTEGKSALSYVDWPPCCDEDEDREVAEIIQLLLQHGANDLQSLLDEYVNRRNRGLLGSDCPLTDKIIVAHLALLEAKNPSSLTHDSSRKTIESFPPMKAHYDKCSRDVEKLKRFEVYGSLTLFKFLTEGEDKVLAYSRNQELISAFSGVFGNSAHLEPYYVDFAQKRLLRASDLAASQDDAALVIEALTGLSSTRYYHIVHLIIRYLDRQDLRNLNNIQKADLNEISRNREEKRKIDEKQESK